MSRFYKGSKGYKGTILNTAILKEDVMLVQALIKMGEKTIDTTSYTANNGDKYSNVTPISIALCKKSPEILAVLLKASDVTESIGIKCFVINKTFNSPFQLAEAIAKATDDKNAIVVRINTQK